MMRKLPFRASGHKAAIADGALALTYEDEGSLPAHLAHLAPFIPELGHAQCATCGQDLDLEVRVAEVVVKEPCPYPDGLTPVITLAVPSGRLIVTDDLRPAYNWRDEDLTVSYNTALGQAEATRAMAAQGCAYGAVLNTSPSLYRTGPDSYVIASVAFAFSDDDEDEGGEVVPDGWEHLATVSTDLWAYSIADYEDWQSRDWDRARRAELGKLDTIVSVPAGTYQFTHHATERGFTYPHDTEETVIFAHIERTGK